MADFKIWSDDPKGNAHDTLLKRQKQLSTSSKARKQRRAESNLCTICGVNPPEGQLKSCKPCRDHLSEQRKARNKSRQTAGLCPLCGEKATAASQCLKHWIQQATDRARLPYSDGRTLLKLLESQNYRCALTGRLLVPGKNASLDHIIPKARGGKNVIGNIQWVDLTVNLCKRDLLGDELLQMARDLIAHNKKEGTGGLQH